ncbi:hypothetical protein J6590_009735 [Homalodisca vitripennis]|nr:hypothetical protein J6590_009735 [Homalodisca vitripennis]
MAAKKEGTGPVAGTCGVLARGGVGVTKGMSSGDSDSVIVERTDVRCYHVLLQLLLFVAALFSWATTRGVSRGLHHCRCRNGALDLTCCMSHFSSSTGLLLADRLFSHYQPLARYCRMSVCLSVYTA